MASFLLSFDGAVKIASAALHCAHVVERGQQVRAVRTHLAGQVHGHAVRSNGARKVPQPATDSPQRTGRSCRLFRIGKLLLAYLQGAFRNQAGLGARLIPSNMSDCMESAST